MVYAGIWGVGPAVDPASLGATTEGASQRAIEHHYDVGRDFYDLWLDARRVYSCGYWPGPLDDDLDAAQMAKLAWHATAAGADGAFARARRRLRLGSLARVSDRRARGCPRHRAHPQHRSGRRRPRPLPAGPRSAWRTGGTTSPTAGYDAIICVGAFEHFARADLDREARRAVYRAFFERCAAWLPAAGRLSLQTIGYEDFDPARATVSTFFTEDIFPDSGLPWLSDIVAASEGTFRVRALRSDANHYEHTLHLWQRRLQVNEVAALAVVDRVVYRRYLRYLRVSRAMFDRGVCTLYRIVLERRPRKGHRR